jgi:hypothetical protein
VVALVRVSDYLSSDGCRRSGRAVNLVAGVDSSTQGCKVVVCDAETGQEIRSGRTPHPVGTEVSPDAWWIACARRYRAPADWRTLQR